MVTSGVASEARGVPQKTDSPNFLILDYFQGHLTAKVKAELWEEHVDMLVIPGGLTRQLRPLDVSVNMLFNDLLCREYEARELKPTRLVKRASLEAVCR